MMSQFIGYWITSVLLSVAGLKFLHVLQRMLNLHRMNELQYLWTDVHVTFDLDVEPPTQWHIDSDQKHGHVSPIPSHAAKKLRRH